MALYTAVLAELASKDEKPSSTQVSPIPPVTLRHPPFRPNLPRKAEAMRIAEIFHSIQGEGLLTGVPSVFIRTSGCNLRCDWCDTARNRGSGSRETSGKAGSRSGDSSRFPLHRCTDATPVFKRVTPLGMPENSTVWKPISRKITPARTPFAICGETTLSNTPSVKRAPLIADRQTSQTLKRSITCLSFASLRLRVNEHHTIDASQRTPHAALDLLECGAGNFSTRGDSQPTRDRYHG